MGSFFQYTLAQKVHGSALVEPVKKVRPREMPVESSKPEVKATGEGERIVNQMVRSFDDILNRSRSERRYYVPPEQGGDPFAPP